MTFRTETCGLRITNSMQTGPLTCIGNQHIRTKEENPKNQPKPPKLPNRQLHQRKKTAR